MDTRVGRDIDGGNGAVASLGAIAAITVAGALVPARSWLGTANVALVLVIVVVAAASLAGRLAGTVTSVVAAISFDFFHTRPYGNLTIDRHEDVVTVVLLLAIGLVVGELAARRTASVRASAVTAASAAGLEAVAAIVAAGRGMSQVWPVVRNVLVDQLGLDSCRFEPTPFADDHAHLERSGRLPGTEHRLAPGGLALPPDGADIAVTHAGRLLGRIVLVPHPGRGTSKPQRRMAVALADQLAVAATCTPVLEPLS